MKPKDTLAKLAKQASQNKLAVEDGSSVTPVFRIAEDRASRTMQVYVGLRCHSVPAKDFLGFRENNSVDYLVNSF